MRVRARLALATGAIVLVVLGLFGASIYFDLVGSENDPAAMAVIARDASRAIVLGGIAAACAALLAAWVVSERMLQPLISIVNAAAQLARGGDFTRRLPTDTSDPEVLRLTRTFNDLLARVDTVLTAQRQLLADTSHELRTPLTTVRGNLDLLERELPPAERSDVLAESREEVDRMARLIRDLLLLADTGQPRQLQLERDPLRLDLLVREVVDRVAGPDAGRVDVRDEPVIAHGDDERLRQLVGNLVQNALRHASAEPGAVQVRVLRRPPNAVLEVEDDGPGIPPEALERIFDRFYRLDRGRSRSQGGSGLGLAIVRHVAESHGGTARAANRQDHHGALFTVELPAEPSWHGAGPT